MSPASPYPNCKHGSALAFLHRAETKLILAKYQTRAITENSYLFSSALRQRMHRERRAMALGSVTCVLAASVLIKMRVFLT